MALDIPSRWGRASSILAGVVWLIIWLHQRATHGPSAVNEMRLQLGLTWMDSGKFLVVPFTLLTVAILCLSQYRCAREDWVGRWGARVTLFSLAMLIVTTAVEFWPFRWGSYADDFESTLPRLGGAIQSVASLIFTLGLVLLSSALARAKLMSIWMVPVLAIGAVTTYFLTVVSWLPGVVWLLLGVVLWRLPDATSTDPLNPEMPAP